MPAEPYNSETIKHCYDQLMAIGARVALASNICDWDFESDIDAHIQGQTFRDLTGFALELRRLVELLDAHDDAKKSMVGLFTARRTNDGFTVERTEAEISVWKFINTCVHAHYTNVIRNSFELALLLEQDRDALFHHVTKYRTREHFLPMVLVVSERSGGHFLQLKEFIISCDKLIENFEKICSSKKLYLTSDYR